MKSARALNEDISCTTKDHPGRRWLPPESESIPMHHGSSMIVAVSCAAFSTLSASAVPDESQFGPCDIMELVMVVDSSESLEPSKELCVSIEVARDGLDPEFHRTVVVAEGGYPVTCSERCRRRGGPCAPARRMGRLSVGEDDRSRSSRGQGQTPQAPSRMLRSAPSTLPSPSTSPGQAPSALPMAA